MHGARVGRGAAHDRGRCRARSRPWRSRDGRLCVRGASIRVHAEPAVESGREFDMAFVETSAGRARDSFKREITLPGTPQRAEAQSAGTGNQTGGGVCRVDAQDAPSRRKPRRRRPPI